jgi:hypothetical protein
MRSLAQSSSATDLLRVTHLSRSRPGWCEEFGYDGWFIRFAGGQEAFDDMRAVLKSLSRVYARWTPDYAWPDERYGAWWVDEDMLLILTDSFSNLREYVEVEEEGNGTKFNAPAAS